MSIGELTSPVDVSHIDGVTWITLNRPAEANTINLALAHAFHDAVVDAQRHGTRAVVITGAGRAFCGGGDIREMAAAADLAGCIEELAATFHAALLRLGELDAVVIAAVNGAAAGGGLGLALNADIILASERAVFVTAYETVGLTPDSGTSYLLPRAVGLHRALAMSATGQRLDAVSAERIGLVHSVFPPDALLNATRTLAASVASRPSDHMPATRRLHRGDGDDAYRRHLEAETRTIATAARGPEAARLIRGF